MRKAAFVLLAVLATLALAGLFHSSATYEESSSSAAAPAILLGAHTVVNERGEKLHAVLPVVVEHTHVEVTDASRGVLMKQMQDSMRVAGVACSGPNFNAKTCSMWWEKDVTVYDMCPPNGVVRGREAWEQRLETVVKEEPHDKMAFHVIDAGWVGGDTKLAWANGYWAKFLNGKLSKQGRYSAVMREDAGHWRFFVASTIEMQNDNDWVPVKNGEGGELLVATQKIMSTFAHGYNQRNYRLAFQDYSPHARFPFMKEMGGTTLSFAVQALDSQKKQLSPAHMTMQVDEALIISKDKLTGVAHGFSKMTDASSKIYTMGKYSFLVIVDRKTVSSPWRVKYDFSPNNWLNAPNVH